MGSVASLEYGELWPMVRIGVGVWALEVIDWIITAIEHKISLNVHTFNYLIEPNF